MAQAAPERAHRGRFPRVRYLKLETKRPFDPILRIEGPLFFVIN
jgi:hypothetical protein